MLKNTELREAALGWIKALPAGKTFDNTDLYQFLEQAFRKSVGYAVMLKKK